MWRLDWLWMWLEYSTVSQFSQIVLHEVWERTTMYWIGYLDREQLVRQQKSTLSMGCQWSVLCLERYFWVAPLWLYSKGYVYLKKCYEFVETFYFQSLFYPAIHVTVEVEDQKEMEEKKDGPGRCHSNQGWDKLYFISVTFRMWNWKFKRHSHIWANFCAGAWKQLDKMRKKEPAHCSR